MPNLKLAFGSTGNSQLVFADRPFTRSPWVTAGTTGRVPLDGQDVRQVATLWPLLRQSGLAPTTEYGHISVWPTHLVLPTRGDQARTRRQVTGMLCAFFGVDAADISVVARDTPFSPPPKTIYFEVWVASETTYHFGVPLNDGQLSKLRNGLRRNATISFEAYPDRLIIRQRKGSLQRRPQESVDGFNLRVSTRQMELRQEAERLLRDTGVRGDLVQVTNMFENLKRCERMDG